MRWRRAFVTGLSLAAFLLATGCLRSAEQRALLDREVGRGEAGGVTLSVRDGLAAVRRMEAGELVLWAQAPVLELHLQAGDEAEEQWSIAIDNCMPGAELHGERDDGAPAVTALSDNPAPTRRQWSVLLPRGASTTLRLAPPDEAEAAPWRFAFLSDIQEAVDRIQDIFARVNADPQVRFVLSGGDLTESGSRAELERFQRELGGLAVPFFTTIGNHDAGSGVPADWHELFGRTSFHFASRGVEFSLVDASAASIDPLVYDLLEGWLDAARDRVHVFVMHLAPVDPIGVRNGSFGSRHEAAKLLTLLSQGHVDLTLYGHVHSFYAFANAGIPAYISGRGGAIPETLDGIGRHYLTVDLDAAAGVAGVSIVRID
jgi:3',5'-cyclic-AMP phosphodiesterase